jgi:hypothetical protein
VRNRTLVAPIHRTLHVTDAELGIKQLKEVSLETEFSFVEERKYHFCQSYEILLFSALVYYR